MAPGGRHQVKLPMKRTSFSPDGGAPYPTYNATATTAPTTAPTTFSYSAPTAAPTAIASPPPVIGAPPPCSSAPAVCTTCAAYYYCGTAPDANCANAPTNCADCAPFLHCLSATAAPTAAPTATPTVVPTTAPTTAPTTVPATAPTVAPTTAAPTANEAKAALPTCATGGILVSGPSGGNYCRYDGKIGTWSPTNFIDQDATALRGATAETCMERCNADSSCACGQFDNGGFCYKIGAAGCGNGDPSTLGTNSYYTMYQKMS